MVWQITILRLRVVASPQENQPSLIISLGQLRSDGARREGSGEQPCSVRRDAKPVHRLISDTVVVEGLILRHLFVQLSEGVAVPECLSECFAFRDFIGWHRDNNLRLPVTALRISV
ncbi:MAG: hypothetical protein OXG91_00865 [bacterium]|nr:hypothetical protein [bacterium]